MMRLLPTFKCKLPRGQYAKIILHSPHNSAYVIITFYEKEMRFKEPEASWRQEVAGLGCIWSWCAQLQNQTSGDASAKIKASWRSSLSLVICMFICFNSFLRNTSFWESGIRFCNCSVTQSCLTPCDPMDCSTPGLPVHHQLPEFTQIHDHWVGNAILPSHPLLSHSPPAFNLS